MIRLGYVYKIYKKLYIVLDYFFLEQLDFSLEQLQIHIKKIKHEKSGHNINVAYTRK